MWTHRSELVRGFEGRGRLPEKNSLVGKNGMTKKSPFARGLVNWGYKTARERTVVLET